MLPIALLTDRAKKRLKTKHPWIFSNELQSKVAAEPGDLVQIQDANGHFIGLGYYNPRTLIAIRVLSLSHNFNLAERIRSSVASRKTLGPVCRLVYSESDGLPGLIADRYNKTLVVQLLTAGMERFRNEILETLIQEILPERILFRNDTPYRELEGLPSQVQWVYGDPLDREIIELDGIRFRIDYATGQKTGFFLDQRENRRRVVAYGPAENMLDGFAYSGAWSMYAAKAGIKEITAIDVSEEALKLADENARLNGFQIKTVVAKAIDYFRDAYESTERYDRIVLDPPAFCKSKRHLPAALKAYREVNLRAMKMLRSGGLLFTCSCSQPVSPEIFLEVLRQASVASGRMFYLRELLFQPPDHPILMNFPESHYLKCAILQVL